MRYVLVPLELLERAKIEIIEGYMGEDIEIEDIVILKEIDSVIMHNTAINEFRH